MRVPVLVRLRELEPADLKLEGERLADRLWALGVTSRARLDGLGERVYRGEWTRMFEPVWLLDGLDEVPQPGFGEAFLQRLASLPGQKVLTCRTAVYESLRREADPYREREYDVLGLKLHEQLAFLTHAREGDSERAEALHRAVQAHPAIRPLAANPLMLSLIAEIEDADRLPVTRAAFYAGAVRAMWARKLGEEPEADSFVEQRDLLLTTIAGEMGMERVEESLATLNKAARETDAAEWKRLAEYVRRAGLLRVDRGRERISFLHLTFQEYFLARALADGGLQLALQRYWEDARYEETLGLLVSLLLERGEWEQVEHGIRWLVEWGAKVHRRDPHLLWGKHRGPFRVALHVLGRAGANLEVDGPLAALAAFLHARITASKLRKWAVAENASTPPEVLSRLAADPDAESRRGVARNASTPPEVLGRLAADPEMDVRWGVAQNVTTLLEDLGSKRARLRTRLAGFFLVVLVFLLSLLLWRCESSAVGLDGAMPIVSSSG
ncbi:MAG: NACHT domain-containing protein [Longimicrobiaceae bacterium]